jgi:hypothetical protein
MAGRGLEGLERRHPAQHWRPTSIKGPGQRHRMVMIHMLHRKIPLIHTDQSQNYSRGCLEIEVRLRMCQGHRRHLCLAVRNVAALPPGGHAQCRCPNDCMLQGIPLRRQLRRRQELRGPCLFHFEPTQMGCKPRQNTRAVGRKLDCLAWLRGSSWPPTREEGRSTIARFNVRENGRQMSQLGSNSAFPRHR